MKNINRYKVIIIIAAVVLMTSISLGINVINLIIIGFIFLFGMASFGYILNNQNKKEKEYLNKVLEIFDED
jgi:4-hydroxybenzoate polyprenyltransferase